MKFSLYYYGLSLVAIIITLGAQLFINVTYKKYSKKYNLKNITGKSVARNILDINGLSNISVLKVSGNLTDHYDPRSKVVRLSEHIYDESSISSVAVSAHECGHAIQDKIGFIFLRLRSFIVPLVNFSSKAGYVAIVLGFIFSSPTFIKIGIISELVILLFQIITLPVEFDASRRGLKILKENNYLTNEELRGARKVLLAAAMTYVASVATSLIEVLRLVLIFTRRND